MNSNAPPPLPQTNRRQPKALPPGMRPHRGKQLLILGCCAFFFAPCGFVTMFLSRRDLRAMKAGTMDPTGESMTRTAQLAAIVASLVWLIKWMILLSAGTLVYQYYYGK